MSHRDPTRDEVQELRDAEALVRPMGEVHARYAARLAFEECMMNPGNAASRNKLSAAFEFLARCV